MGVLIARYLGAEWFGHLNYSLTMVAIVAPIVKLGLSNIVVREISLQADTKYALLGTSFALQIIVAVVLLISLLLFVYFTEIGATETDFLISILAFTLIFQCVDPIVAWNQSQLISKYTVWPSRISIIIGFAICLLYTSPSPRDRG